MTNTTAPKRKRLSARLIVFAAAMPITVAAGILLFFYIAALLDLNPEVVERFRISLLMALTGQTSFTLSNSACWLLDIPGEGPRVFKLEMSGRLAGPPGTSVIFVGPFAPPVAGEKTCADWPSCVRPEDGPVFTTWTLSATGIPEDWIVPDYAASIVAEVGRDGDISEEPLSVPCGTAYTLSVEAFREVPNAGGTLSAKPQVFGCDSYCQTKVLRGDVIRFYATPAQDSYFAGWDDDCYGTPIDEPCVLVMDRAKSVTANFSALAPVAADPPPDPDTGETIQNSYGSVSFTCVCRYVGSYGINLSEYEIVLTGEATAPAGGNFRVYTDPSNTYSPEVDCGSWDRGNDCTSTGQSTSWTYVYGFTSQGRPGTLEPEVSVTDASYNILASAAAQVSCP